MSAPLALLLLCCGLGGVLALALPPLQLSFSLQLNEATSAGTVSCATHSVTPVSCAEPRPDALLAHPDHCQLFYYCETGRRRPTCRRCPAGLHFNPALRVCDWPQQAGCTAPAGTPQATTVAYEPTTTESNATWPWTTSAGLSNTTDRPLSNSTAQSSLDPTASTETSSPDATNSSSTWSPSARTADITTPDAPTSPDNTNWVELASTVGPGEPSTDHPGAYTAPSTVMWKLLN